MAHKFHNTKWHLYFVTVDASGGHFTKKKGFHLKDVDMTGKILDAEDDDHKPITGQAAPDGSSISMDRKDSPTQKLHFEGVLLFEDLVKGTMVLAGIKKPIPTAKAGQEEGTWVGTQP